jgi:hypothetical protein
MRPQRRRQPQASIQSFYLPGPSGGLNTISPGHMLPEGDCLRCFNLIAGEHGLRSRLGEREWCTGLTGGLTNEVRTLIPYIGSAANGTSNRLFACTSTGIWDVSASSTSPTQLVAFATTSEDAGFGICHAMVTAGGHFLLYCDEENGYHVYTEATDTWAKVAAGAGAGQLAGVDPANVVFVTVWKSRVWFVEKNSARVWYLPAGTIYGTAQKLDLDKSAQFRGGGPVVGLWNWTLTAASASMTTWWPCPRAATWRCTRAAIPRAPRPLRSRGPGRWAACPPAGTSPPTWAATFSSQASPGCGRSRSWWRAATARARTRPPRWPTSSTSSPSRAARCLAGASTSTPRTTRCW